MKGKIAVICSTQRDFESLMDLMRYSDSKSKFHRVSKVGDVRGVAFIDFIEIGDFVDTRKKSDIMKHLLPRLPNQHNGR